MVSVLCCHKRSIYKTMDVDCYDIDRDCRIFKGNNMVICHPPCRTFSKLRWHVKNKGDDLAIADFCIETLKKNGGILEQPARSTMLKKFGLHDPVYVDQFWFDYPVRKATWLWFFDCDPLTIPLKLNNLSVNSIENMSYFQRSATTRKFADYLINCIKRSDRYEKAFQNT